MEATKDTTHDATLALSFVHESEQHMRLKCHLWQGSGAAALPAQLDMSTISLHVASVHYHASVVFCLSCYQIISKVPGALPQ